MRSQRDPRFPDIELGRTGTKQRWASAPMPMRMLLSPTLWEVRPAVRDFVLALLLFVDWDDLTAYPTQKTLTKITGLGLSTIQTAAAEAEEAGLVQSDRKYVQGATRLVYRLTPDRCADPGAKPLRRTRRNTPGALRGAVRDRCAETERPLRRDEATVAPTPAPKQSLEHILERSQEQQQQHQEPAIDFQPDAAADVVVVREALHGGGIRGPNLERLATGEHSLERIREVIAWVKAEGRPQGAIVAALDQDWDCLPNLGDEPAPKPDGRPPAEYDRPIGPLPLTEAQLDAQLNEARRLASVETLDQCSPDEVAALWSTLIGEMPSLRNVHGESLPDGWRKHSALPQLLCDRLMAKREIAA